jgi:hypothetical protein
MTFYLNGSAKAVDLSGKRPPLWTAWWIERETLQAGYRLPPLLEPLAHALSRRTGHPIFLFRPKPDSDFVFLSEDEFRIPSDMTKDGMIYRRVKD